MNSFIQVAQQYGPLLTALIAVAAVLGIAFAIYKVLLSWTFHNRQLKGLQSRIDELLHENQRLLKVEMQVSAWENENRNLRQTIESLTAKLEGAREEAAERDRAERACGEQVNLNPHEAVQQGGKVASVPPVTPPSSRVRRSHKAVRPGNEVPEELRRWLEGATLTERGLSFDGDAVHAVIGTWPCKDGESFFDALLTAITADGRRLPLDQLGLFAGHADATGKWLCHGWVTARKEIRVEKLRRCQQYQLCVPSVWGSSEGMLALSSGDESPCSDSGIPPEALPMHRSLDGRIRCQVRCLEKLDVEVVFATESGELAEALVEFFFVTVDGSVVHSGKVRLQWTGRALWEGIWEGSVARIEPVKLIFMLDQEEL